MVHDRVHPLGLTPRDIPSQQSPQPLPWLPLDLDATSQASPTARPRFPSHHQRDTAENGLDTVSFLVGQAKEVSVTKENPRCYGSDGRVLQKSWESREGAPNEGTQEVIRGQPGQGIVQAGCPGFVQSRRTGVQDM